MAVIRFLSSEDSVEEITSLLHRAYAKLLEQGLEFVATTQSVEVTRERLGYGYALVAAIDSRLVGTISFFEPHHGDSKVYDQPGTWVFGQFAVEPGCQGQGIGAGLIRRAEQESRLVGAKRMACDTASGATELIAYYKNLGYSEEGTVDWPSTNYVSTVLAKSLC